VTLLLILGQSVTCDTKQDAEARIAITGATGGILGKPVLKGHGARELDIEARDIETRSVACISKFPASLRMSSHAPYQIHTHRTSGLQSQGQARP
jgi:hypothetical protein